MKNGKKKKPNDYGTGISQHEMEALARVLLPEIEKFYVSEDGQRQFAQWQASRLRVKKRSDGLQAVIYIKNEYIRRSAKELLWFLSYTEIRQK